MYTLLDTSYIIPYKIHNYRVESRSSCRGALRLVNGANAREVRVEICIRGTWNTVCGNDYGTGSSEASTVCMYTARLFSQRQVIVIMQEDLYNSYN